MWALEDVDKAGVHVCVRRLPMLSRSVYQREATAFPGSRLCDMACFGTLAEQRILITWNRLSFEIHTHCASGTTLIEATSRVLD